MALSLSFCFVSQFKSLLFPRVNCLFGFDFNFFTSVLRFGAQFCGLQAEDCWSSSALNQAFEAQGRSEGMVEEEISYHWPPNSCDRDSGRRKRESCAEDLRLLLPDQNRMNIVTH